MKMKRIVFPQEVHVYSSNYTCPHRGRIGPHGKKLDSSFCFYDEKKPRDCSPENDPEGFPEWCPLDDHDPDCVTVSALDLLDQAADCQRKLEKEIESLRAQLRARDEVVEAARILIETNEDHRTLFLEALISLDKALAYLREVEGRE